MGGTPRTSRVFILSQTSLFAQGIRSLLDGEPSIEILGIEGDPARALDAARSLRPDVILAEVPGGAGASPVIGQILRGGLAAKVVALDLNHDFATVYMRNRVPVKKAADLLRAIRSSPGEGVCSRAAGGLIRDGDAKPTSRSTGATTGKAAQGDESCSPDDRS